MKRVLLLFSAFLQALCVCSQDYLHQVLVLNEGYFDYTTQQMIEPVTIGSYNPDTDLYTEVVVIDSVRFASDIIIDDGSFYVAADNKVLKYDLDTYNLLEETTILGIRNIAIHDGKLFVSRGDYDSNTFSSVLFNSYLQVYDKYTLDFIQDFDTIIGPKWSTQDIIIEGDYLYIAINNGFEFGNEQGFIGILDLKIL